MITIVDNDEKQYYQQEIKHLYRKQKHLCMYLGEIGYFQVKYFFKHGKLNIVFFLLQMGM